MKFIKWATFLALILTVSTIIFYKPSRVLIPEMNGVNCATKSLCIDDISRLEEAEALIAHAVIEMEDVLGPLKNYPKAVFCSTQECFEKFGSNLDSEWYRTVDQDRLVLAIKQLE